MLGLTVDDNRPACRPPSLPPSVEGGAARRRRKECRPPSLVLAPRRGAPAPEATERFHPSVYRPLPFGWYKPPPPGVRTGDLPSQGRQGTAGPPLLQPGQLHPHGEPTGEHRLQLDDVDLLHLSPQTLDPLIQLAGAQPPQAFQVFLHRVLSLVPGGLVLFAVKTLVSVCINCGSSMEKNRRTWPLCFPSHQHRSATWKTERAPPHLKNWSSFANTTTYRLIICSV